MRITVLVAALMVSSMAASAQSSSSQSTASAGSTMTGCVKGAKHQFYLVQKNGHRHTLMDKSEDLSAYVGHEVTVTGKADTSRARGSDAEGHRSGFFSVDSVKDQGSCKK